MKPVHQTIVDQKIGNCLSAALASILELDLNDVPDFMRFFGGNGFDRAVHLWLESQGWAWLRVCMPREREPEPARGRLPDCGDEIRFHPLPEGVLCLATGRSPRGPWYHSVVGHITGGFNFELIHDPFPDGPGLDGLPTCIEFLIPRNPANMKRIQA